MALLLILRGEILISLLCVPSGLWVWVLSNEPDLSYIERFAREATHFSVVRLWSLEDSLCKEIDEQQSAEEQSLSMRSD